MQRGAALLASLYLALLPAVSSAAGSDAALLTHAESTQFEETGRFAEVERLCGAFERAYPGAARCLRFGTTAAGRPMLAVVASRSGVLEPLEARRRGLPVLLAQGGIHAGEVDGKDAGLIALREVLAGRAAQGSLEQLVFVFVPVFNVDGHERFGAWHRPNQNGPRAMGWRVTAGNLNLNRDYAKADAPEMRAMLALLGAWDPIVYADLHTTDGADFQPHISVQVEPLLGGSAELQPLGRQLRDGVLADLTAAGDIALPFYPSFVRDDDPASGFAMDVAPPRYSHVYWSERNRFGVLVETHSWKSYRTRVSSTRNTLYSLLEHTARSGRSWLAAAHAADAADAAGGGPDFPLAYETRLDATLIDFPGYAYQTGTSDISGQRWIRYDASRKTVWRVPLFERVAIKATAAAPRGGYLVPAQEAALLAERLQAHGIAFRTISKELLDQPVSEYKADSFSFHSTPFEGRTQLNLSGQWKPVRVDILPGALYVPGNQPRARLLVALLEPAAPDSFVQWGFFNRLFEQKEYMEPYVAEQVAAGMLAADPALRQEFETKLANDPAFRADPSARLEFFQRRHPSWDDRYAVYPVLRVEQPLPGQ